jgi:hypothetical protein
VLVAVGSAACALTFDGLNTAGQAYELTIIDPDGLVDSYAIRTPEAARLGVSGDGVHAVADPNSVWVTWTGLPCETRPSIEVSRAEDDRIAVALDRGPAEGETCVAMESGYGVALVLAEPVDIADIEFSDTASGP